MKRKIVLMVVLVFLFSAILAPLAKTSVQAEPDTTPPEEPDTTWTWEPEEPSLPDWFVDGNGTYFEVTNSSYLNVTLTSSECVHVVLESVPHIVSFHIESNGSATSTVLTFNGFEPGTTYYRHEEGYLIEEFTTDLNGEYTYTQSISEPHHVYILEYTSTLYISSDYTFTSDINEMIVVAADNIVIDGNGYTLQGPGGGGSYGFYLAYRSGVTIKNVRVKGWTYGFLLYMSSSNSISGNNITNNGTGMFLWISSNHNSVSENNITNNGSVGIYLQDSSDHNSISGNSIITNNYAGVLLVRSSSNSISGNNIASNRYGIQLRDSSNNILRRNSLATNQRNFGVTGKSLPDFVNDVDASNTVDGKPIYYWISKQDMAVPLDAGYVAIVNCMRITVQSLNLANNWQGALLAYTSNSIISGNNMASNEYGIRLYMSSSNSISGNNMASNEYGIYLYMSSSNSISGNSVTANRLDGIRLVDSSSNSISGNNITSCDYGIHLSSFSNHNSISGNSVTANDEAGIQLALSSDHNSISGNSVTNGGWHGIVLGGASNHNSISGNNITANNEDGILLGLSSSNSISGNNIASNGYGIVLFWSSSYNSISGNSITNNGDGIWVYYYSSYNSISKNSIASNGYGIVLFWSSNNVVYHNNVIDNVDQAYDTSPANNNWHHPGLLEGNYWSDYPGVDDGSGTGKHAIAGDGIGDTNIPWPGPNFDYYPYVYKLDITPPEITIVTPEPYGLYIVGMALDFYATDAESGVATIVGQLTNTAGDYQEVDSGFIPLPGVYTLVVVATDNSGNTAESDPVFFVVFDPEGGFATGGGWIFPDVESTLPGGKANFGFVAKHKQGSSTGNLEFQYHDADINLKSTTIDWLVISGISAQFQGIATINGEGLYTFRVMTKDKGEPGVGSDEFDIRIWEGTDIEVDPIVKAKNSIAGGNIIIHKK